MSSGGRRILRDHSFGKRSSVERDPSEKWACRHGGAFYDRGPAVTEVVSRIVVTYTGDWETS